MVQQHVSARRASSLALHSNTQQNPTSATDFIKVSRARIEFQILILQSEMKILNELAAMDDEQKKRDMLFDTLCHEGPLSAKDLATGLRQIEGDVSFQTRVSLAADDVDASSKEFIVDANEFASLCDIMTKTIGCSFQELSEMLVMKVLFAPTDNNLQVSPQQEQLSESAEEKKDVKIDNNLRAAMKDRRMKALFKVFDANGENAVDFKELVVGLYKLADGIDEASHAAVSALLLFDKTQSRSLSYKDFARFILSFVASLPERLTFDAVADDLTRHAIDASSGVTADYVIKKFSMDTTTKLLLNIEDDDEFVDMGVVELAKMDRLFGMFDANHDGSIDANDLALGLRYVQGASWFIIPQSSSHLHFLSARIENYTRRPV